MCRYTNQYCKTMCLEINCKQIKTLNIKQVRNATVLTHGATGLNTSSPYTQNWNIRVVLKEIRSSWLSNKPLKWKQAQWRWARAILPRSSGKNTECGWPQLWQSSWFYLSTKGEGSFRYTATNSRVDPLAG